MDEYTPCRKSDPTAREAIGNVMRLLRVQSRKKNKYNARKTVMCGHTFDSKREAEIYLDLLSRKQHGEIVRIRLQPSYADGRHEVIEVKGMRTRDYLLRKKLFLHMMRETDIVFREVR